MAVPFSDRSALCTLPELCLRGKTRVTEAELQKNFLSVANPLHSAFSCIQLLSSSEVRFCFTSPRKMEDVINTGLTFRDHPLTLHPIHTKKWVTIRRLAYGTPVEFVNKVLSPYGDVGTIKPEIIDRIATGTLFASMDIKRDIPSKLMIRGHACHIWYRDQIRTCYWCNDPDHQSRQCPQQRGRCILQPHQSNRAPQTPVSCHPPSPSVSPTRSPSGSLTPPNLRRLAMAKANNARSRPSATTSTVTPGRTYATVTAQEQSTPAPPHFSL